MKAGSRERLSRIAGMVERLRDVDSINHAILTQSCTKILGHIGELLADDPLTQDADPGEQGWEVCERGDTANLTLWYPRMVSTSRDRVWRVVVNLIDVRAADPIRVSYDFTRDGWMIEQQSTFSWPADDEVRDPDWQEVAFVQAWGREGTTECE